MSRQLLWRALAIGAALVLISAGAYAVFDHAPSNDVRDGSSLSATSDKNAPDGSSSDEATSGVTSPLVATTDAGEIIPPKSTTKRPSGTTPGTPGTPATPATPPGGLTPEEEAYREETRRVVEENRGDLTAIAEAVSEALGDGDDSGLASLIAPDERDPMSSAQLLIDAYPAFDSAQLGSSVNIFSTGEMTLYFTYALVTWTDGGITSEHTIPIVLRYIDGEWRVSSLGASAPDLEFVQSVTL